MLLRSRVVVRFLEWYKRPQVHCSGKLKLHYRRDRLRIAATGTDKLNPRWFATGDLATRDHATRDHEMCVHSPRDGLKNLQNTD